MIAEIIFWTFLFAVFYPYFGYPAVLAFLSLFKKMQTAKGDVEPSVSFIITAFNEEKRIEEKLKNTLGLNYTQNKLEIIVASDNSTDNTDNIVRAYEKSGVKFVSAPERRGKEFAQQCAVAVAKGDVFIFSDVATILEPEAVKNIARNFSDPTVGCVSSVDKFINSDNSISGEGAYVQYEMFLRSLESKVNTLVGLSGSFFAARKEVCKDWADDLQSDFNTLFNSVKLGMRGVSDPESIGYYRNISDEKKEYERKVRTVLRGISVFMSSLSFLNPIKYGLFSWQLFSHKLCRWLVPFALIILFLSNAVICFSALTSALSSSFYCYFFLLQAGFYIIAALGATTSVFNKLSILKIPYFFVLVNASILSAWLRYFRGERIAKWTPSER